MLKFNKVYKSFGDFIAVRGISFDLKRGDIAGLLGPNGAGKTTTMRMATSYYYPDKGTITINGFDTTKDTLKTQQEIGYLPENNPLYLDMITIDYLTMSAKFFGITGNNLQQRIKEVSKAVGIKDKLTSPLGHLSKGYKQRVGIASALIHNPSILILDEPTEGLDPIQREEIRKLIKEISKDKIILISTHVLQEVKAVCNKVVVMNEGRVIKFGKPADLTKSKSFFVKIEGNNIENELNTSSKENQFTYEIEKSEEKITSVKINSEKELRPLISELSGKNNWIIWEMYVEDALSEIFHHIKEEHDND